MITILPSIDTNDPLEIKRKVEAVGTFAKKIHLDISDGNLFPSSTVSLKEAEEALSEISYDGEIECHLMVEEPIRLVESVSKIKGVTSVVIHKEAMKDPFETIALFQARGIKVGISVSINEDRLGCEGLPIDYFLVLSEKNPGFSGEFNPIALNQIDNIKKEFPDLPIEVDGGINEITGKESVLHGATTLISTAYIFKGDDILERYNILQNLDEPVN